MTARCGSLHLIEQISNVGSFSGGLCIDLERILIALVLAGSLFLLLLRSYYAVKYRLYSKKEIKDLFDTILISVVTPVCVGFGIDALFVNDGFVEDLLVRFSETKCGGGFFEDLNAYFSEIMNGSIWSSTVSLLLVCVSMRAFVYYVMRKGSDEEK